ncbi:MAG TPA: hypothetical protein VHQ90_13515 [Thermoanaerobaculia bacterium]|nr:hypothetical protein [Thermoanaerobaculia bacterium]
MCLPLLDRQPIPCGPERRRELPALGSLHALILVLCRGTRRFPGSDPAGLAVGMRRAALGAAEAVVTGYAQDRLADELPAAARRLREVGFYIEISWRLGYIPAAAAAELTASQQAASRDVTALAWSLEEPPTGQAAARAAS